MKIAKEGWRLILPSLVICLLFFKLGWLPLAVLFILLTAALLFFFRDPRRTPPEGEHLIVSPADGQVMSVDRIDSHPDLEGPANRVVIFLSLLNVHVVRAPLAAAVSRVDYNPGLFLPAYRPEAGEKNESSTLVFKEGLTELVLKLSVGVAARRIKTRVRRGDHVDRGQRIGLMFFGSRSEITVPTGVEIKVKPGDRVRGAETIIAEVKP